jgi:phage repressor protein C with HTH and peptisase S24 domain
MDDVVAEQAVLLKAARTKAGLSAAQLADEIRALATEMDDEFTLSQQAVSYFESGKAKTIPRWLRYATQVLRQHRAISAKDAVTLEDSGSPFDPSSTWLRNREVDDVDEAFLDETSDLAPDTRLRLLDVIKHLKEPAQLLRLGKLLSFSDENAGADLDLVPITSIDLAYGMGGTFTDIPVEEDVMHFPRRWIQSITNTPPEFLTFVRGRGDSMSPTIHDDDMILVDRSQKRVRDQDMIWAITVGDIGMIKRLRLRANGVTILSDNERVPPDEATGDEVHIVGRVIYICHSV